MAATIPSAIVGSSGESTQPFVCAPRKATDVNRKIATLAIDTSLLILFIPSFNESYIDGLE
jgi:hypothetical protein